MRNNRAACYTRSGRLCRSVLHIPLRSICSYRYSTCSALRALRRSRRIVQRPFQLRHLFQLRQAPSTAPIAIPDLEDLFDNSNGPGPLPAGCLKTFRIAITPRTAARSDNCTIFEILFSGTKYRCKRLKNNGLTCPTSDTFWDRTGTELGQSCGTFQFGSAVSLSGTTLSANHEHLHQLTRSTTDTLWNKGGTGEGSERLLTVSKLRRLLAN